MGKFIVFEKMITPIFIQIFFWIGFLGAILGGFGLIGFGIISKSGGFLHIGAGIGSLFISPLVVRVYCEMLIVVFKIQGALLDIRDTLSKQEEVTPKIQSDSPIEETEAV